MAGGELESRLGTHDIILAVTGCYCFGVMYYNTRAFMASNNSSSDLTKQRLMDLRNGLLSLHKTLLDSERSTYERDVARIGSSGELLKLVLYDPWFAWLHELSEFVVLIDETVDAIEETLDAENPPGIDAERLIAQASELLAPNESGSGFAKRYFEALQRDPDVVLAHARMRKVLSSLS